MPRKNDSKKVTPDNILSFSVDELITSVDTRKKIPELKHASDEEARFLPHIDISSLAND